MRKLNLINTLLVVSVLWSAFVISGCKKEATVLPVKTVSAIPAATVDSANYIKGYLGDEPIKFEGNALSYSSYVDPDSAHPGGGHNDYDSYYMSGSKWVTLSGTGLTAYSTNASIEIRSLAVRVFVTPIAATSLTYYNLLGQATYAFVMETTRTPVHMFQYMIKTVCFGPRPATRMEAL